jgi:hypothetical protein
MGSIRFGLPESLVIALQQHGDLREFIETGTFQGGTADWASRHFGHVITMDLPGPWYETAKAALASRPNVNLLCGDSRKLLYGIIDSLPPAIFWLDAHWMGSGPMADLECPLLGEIAAINRSLLPNVLLCDDARYFCTPPPLPHRPEQWPSLNEVVEALANDGKRYVILFEDVLIAVPAEWRTWLTQYLRK